MPRYDQRCKSCGWWNEIVTSPGNHPPCPECGGETERLYIRGYEIWRDEIPGGQMIENLGPVPVRVDSKSELKRLADQAGLVQKVEHKPPRGSDKAPHTQRFV